MRYFSLSACNEPANLPPGVQGWPIHRQQCRERLLKNRPHQDCANAVLHISFTKSDVNLTTSLSPGSKHLRA
jgi:hypothetical protein